MNITKRILSLAMILLMMLTVAPISRLQSNPFILTAEAASSGGFSYEVYDNEIYKNSVFITGYSGKGGNVVIPDTIAGKKVAGIDMFAFEGHTSIKSVKISKNVKHIGEYAFRDCRNLKTIQILNDTADIGDCAFLGTAYYNNSDNWKNSVLYIGKHLVAATGVSGSYTVKKGTTAIASLAFWDCKNLKSIKIPDSVKFIGSGAFIFLDKLEKIELGKGIKKIEYRAFDNCTAIKQVTYNGTKAQWKKIDFTDGNQPLQEAKIKFKSAKPAKVKIKKVKSSAKKTAVVTWEAVKSASGYQVSYSTSKKFTEKTTKNVTVKKAKATKTTIKKLKSGKKYFVRARAYKVSNGKNVYGSWSDVKSVKVK